MVRYACLGTEWSIPGSSMISVRTLWTTDTSRFRTSFTNGSKNISSPSCSSNLFYGKSCWKPILLQLAAHWYANMQHADLHSQCQHDMTWRSKRQIWHIYWTQLRSESLRWQMPEFQEIDLPGWCKSFIMHCNMVQQWLLSAPPVALKCSLVETWQ